MKKYASEDQRHDVELNAAVLAKLVTHREDLKSVISHMREAYKILTATDDLDRSGFGGRFNDTLAHLNSDANSLQWLVTHILSDLEEKTADGTSAYVGNKAAFVSPEKAEKLKKEYRGE